MAMSTLTPLSEAFGNLAQVIDTCAVRQGPADIVRVSTLQGLERAARRVVDALAAAGLSPGSRPEEQPADPLYQAYRQASRLQSGANEGLCCCIDLRLADSPQHFHDLFATPDHAAAERLINPVLSPPQEERRPRRAAAEQTPSRRTKVEPRPPQRVPKHVEMMGKARKLTDLIQTELCEKAGRSITQMCAQVGISRETFGNSKHFAEARAAWASLQQARNQRPGTRNRPQA